MTHILVTTGPESSGKTTLATDLSVALRVALVPEQARGYLNQLYRIRPAGSYQQQDLLEIARLQVAAEQQSLTAGTASMVCDTDLLVIVIWSEVKYGQCEPELLRLFERSLQSHPRTYLLCDPSMPWEPDPLRENPNDRQALHQRYQEKLELWQLPFRSMRGTPAARLDSALGLLDRT